MNSIAQTRPFVVGVDTHAANHVYTLVTMIGQIIGTKKFPSDHRGIARAMDWISKLTSGDMDTLWVVEGAASYGAILTGTLTGAGYFVAEAPAYGKQGGNGKSDELDSARIARAALPLAESDLRIPRLGQGIRAALHILLTAREDMTRDHTRATNALNALVRTHDLGIDARKALTLDQIRIISKWRDRDEELSLSVAHAEAVRRAKHALELGDQIKDNMKQIKKLIVLTEAAPLVKESGYGPISVAICLTAWSHQGRVRNEAAFAVLAGVNPIPASSGNTIRHRLNRRGDRRLNKALYTITLSRMNTDPATIEYAQRRRAQGRTDKEIRRCLKRYIARHIYRTLNTQAQALQTA